TPPATTGAEYSGGYYKETSVWPVYRKVESQAPVRMTPLQSQPQSVSLRRAESTQIESRATTNREVERGTRDEQPVENSRSRQSNFRTIERDMPYRTVTATNRAGDRTQPTRRVDVAATGAYREERSVTTSFAPPSPQSGVRETRAAFAADRAAEPPRQSERAERSIRREEPETTRVQESRSGNR
ncbi:hypothetical protein HZA57_07820, partial [Candidatus Poribacteria bacterium]|nr:hypothetical protein [Candidatus Poribacteria bacterium]